MSNYSPVKLAFKVFEPAEKGNLPDVILLHGMASNKDAWEEVAQDLADKSKRRIYTLDMRNHGDSGWSDEFSWKIMAKDVVHFMDEHSIKSATFIGQSMGGIISMILAHTQPEKVDAIMAEDIGPELPDNELIQVSVSSLGMLKGFLQKLTPDMDVCAAMKDFMENMSRKMPKEFQFPPEQVEKFTTHMKDSIVNRGGKLEPKMNIDVILAFFSDREKRAETGIEGVCHKPALFIYGTASPFKVFDLKDHILELFPKATFKAIEGGTHLGHMQHPEEFLENALEFLKN